MDLIPETCYEVLQFSSQRNKILKRWYGVQCQEKFWFLFHTAHLNDNRKETNDTRTRISGLSTELQKK
jgi:hypothetical protein